jgi:molybdenum cofactor cytidylyltransferase
LVIVTGSRVAAILLAAGLSSRFGRSKQLADLEATALVRRAMDSLERSPVDEIVVVVGHRAADVTEKIRKTRSKIVFNENYEEGIGSSLRTGVAALSREASATLVCLADQPFVTPELLERIIARHRRTGADVVVSVSEGVITPPVLFARKLFGEIADLRGDRGAKSIIERHAGFERVRVRPEVLLDVDTEEDLGRAIKILRAGAVREERGRAAGGP